MSFTQIILDDALAQPLTVQAGSGSVSAVPEPATLFLIGTGFAGIIANCWWKNQTKSYRL